MRTTPGGTRRPGRNQDQIFSTEGNDMTVPLMKPRAGDSNRTDSHHNCQPWLSLSVRATLPLSMLFADCTKPYRNTPSIPKAKGGFLYLLSSWVYTRIGL